MRHRTAVQAPPQRHVPNGQMRPSQRQIQTGGIHRLWILCPPLLFIPFVNISVILSLLQYLYFLLSEFCLSLFFRDAGGDGFQCASFREQRTEKKLKDNMKRNLKMGKCKGKWGVFIIPLFLNEKEEQTERKICVSSVGKEKNTNETSLKVKCVIFLKCVICSFSYMQMQLEWSHS